MALGIGFDGAFLFGAGLITAVFLVSGYPTNVNYIQYDADSLSSESLEMFGQGGSIPGDNEPHHLANQASGKVLVF